MKKVQSILVSQPEPKVDNSPYHDLQNKFKVNQFGILPGYEKEFKYDLPKELAKPMNLSDNDRVDLVLFLKTLTDKTFLFNNSSTTRLLAIKLGDDKIFSSDAVKNAILIFFFFHQIHFQFLMYLNIL